MQCLFEFFFGEGVVVGLFVGHAQVIVEGGAVGGLLHSFFEGVDGRGVSALVIVRPAEGVGSAGEIGQTFAGRLGEGKGNAYVAGGAGPDFPITPGVVQTTFGGGTSMMPSSLS